MLDTVAIRLLRTKKASGNRTLRFDHLYCINERLANDVSLVAKILGYVEGRGSMAKKNRK